MTIVTLMENLSATMLSIRHYKADGYGFFDGSDYGLPNFHFRTELLLKDGFSPDDMRPRETMALFDVELFRADYTNKKTGEVEKDKLQARIVKFHEVDGQPAVEPQLEVAPDIEHEPELVRQIGVVHVGDTVKARFKCGFNGEGKKMANFGFFTPSDPRFKGKDIFAHENNLCADFYDLRASSEVYFMVTIAEINSRGYVGRVDGRWIDGVDVNKVKAALEVRQSAKVKKQRVRQDRQSQVQKRVMSRQELRVETTDGRILQGQPVLEGEWPSLATGTKCVLVEEYVDGTRKFSGVSGYFTVELTGGNKTKADLVEVKFAPYQKKLKESASEDTVQLKKLGLAVFTVNGRTVTATTYEVKTKAEADLLRKEMVRQKLNRVAVCDGKGDYFLAKVGEGQVSAELVTLIEQKDLMKA